MITFSIILPVRNGGDYIKKAVHSILTQTYQDFNLIILDNNSSDGTTEWLQTLTDNRITIHYSDVSLSMTENWGRIIHVPKNEFMTIIGHDDILLPHYLEEMKALITQYPDAALYQSHFNFIDENGKLIRLCQKMDEVQNAADFLKAHIFQTLDSMGTGYMYRSTDYDRLGGIPLHFPNLMFADYTLWIQLTAQSYKATSQSICFEYRIHNSTSKLTNGDLYCEAFENYINFLLEFSKTNAEIKKVCDLYGQHLLMYFCESLSHRLLKTPIQQRKRSVWSHVKKCKALASLMIPDQSFHPMLHWKISTAVLLDTNSLTRKLFLKIKGIS